MPFVRGFLRVVKRRGQPTQPLPDEEDEVDPGYGVEEGELPEVEPPDPPVGVWPPLTPEQPWRPIPSLPERPSTGPVRPGVTPPAGGVGGTPPPRPGPGEPGEPTQPLPPGMIWPPLPGGVTGHYLALVLIGGGGKGVHYRYVVVDADARLPKPPDTWLPEHPEREPK